MTTVTLPAPTLTVADTHRSRRPVTPFSVSPWSCIAQMLPHHTPLTGWKGPVS